MKDNEVLPLDSDVHGGIVPRAERRANRGRRVSSHDRLGLPPLHPGAGGWLVVESPVP